MRSEFTIVACLIVDFCSAKIIMWLAHHRHSVLLSHQLILVYLRQTWICICILEESIVMIRCRAIISLPLEAHFKVCNSHYLGVAHLGLLFQGKFFRRVCLTSRSCVWHFSGTIFRHIKREVWIARLFDQLRIFYLCLGHFVRIELILLTRTVQVLRSRHGLIRCITQKLRKNIMRLSFKMSELKTKQVWAHIF